MSDMKSNSKQQDVFQFVNSLHPLYGVPFLYSNSNNMNSTIMSPIEHDDTSMLLNDSDNTMENHNHPQQQEQNNNNNHHYQQQQQHNINTTNKKQKLNNTKSKEIKVKKKHFKFKDKYLEQYPLQLSTMENGQLVLSCRCCSKIWLGAGKEHDGFNKHLFDSHYACGPRAKQKSKMHYAKFVAFQEVMLRKKRNEFSNDVELEMEVQKALCIHDTNNNQNNNNQNNNNQNNNNIIQQFNLHNINNNNEHKKQSSNIISESRSIIEEQQRIITQIRAGKNNKRKEPGRKKSHPKFREQYLEQFPLLLSLKTSTGQLIVSCRCCSKTWEGQGEDLNEFNKDLFESHYTPGPNAKEKTKLHSLKFQLFQNVVRKRHTGELSENDYNIAIEQALNGVYQLHNNNNNHNINHNNNNNHNNNHNNDNDNDNHHHSSSSSSSSVDDHLHHHHHHHHTLNNNNHHDHDLMMLNAIPTLLPSSLLSNTLYSDINNDNKNNDNITLLEFPICQQQNNNTIKCRFCSYEWFSNICNNNMLEDHFLTNHPMKYHKYNLLKCRKSNNEIGQNEFDILLSTLTDE